MKLSLTIQIETQLELNQITQALELVGEIKSLLKDASLTSTVTEQVNN